VKMRSSPMLSGRHERRSRNSGSPCTFWVNPWGVESRRRSRTEIAAKGVVLVTPWDTLPDLAQDIYRFLPVRRLVRDRYDNIGNLRDFEGPIAVVMAGEDEIIPNRRTKRLYEALPESKRLWTLQGAGHNDWLTVVGGVWWREIMDFVSGSGRDR
jgi:pimeloyl-ACP methyl ester carboxylesterase